MGGLVWSWVSLLPCYPKFLPTTHRCGASLLRVSTPPTSLDGCGFFNSIVVRLPFNSISDSSEWWFHILVVILMCLCKEVSHVCLCCRLDWKSSEENFNEKVALIVSELDITSLENRALVLCIVKLHACLTNLSWLESLQILGLKEGWIDFWGLCM